MRRRQRADEQCGWGAGPGGHGGFLGGEYGQIGEPDAFAGRLREVLEG